jgi:hypothetical protein
MRADSWAGLVTNASPFALPPGAAVEQVNLNTSVPGQLQSRGGMRAISFSGPAAGSVVHCHAVQLGSASVIIAQQSDGAVVLLENPAPAARAAQGHDPQLTAAGGQVVTSYTYRYLDGRYGAAQDTAEPVQADPNVDALDGGQAVTALWPYRLDSVAGCPVSGKLSVVDGGTSRDDELPPDVQESELCAT